MNKILRIAILSVVMAGVLAYVLTPNDSILYFGTNGPQYGSLQSRSVDDPNRSDAPYLGMKTHTPADAQVSKSGPKMYLRSSGSYVSANVAERHHAAQGSVSGGGASIQFKSHPAQAAQAAAVNSAVGGVRFPALTSHNDKKKIKGVEDDDVVETGTMQAVDIHGGGPSVGGKDPHYTPIGDAVLPLALLMLLFVACKRLRRAA